jgi:hypothetical protein
VSDLFRSAGIRHAMLKGCATAQLDYPDPAMRVTGDVDVLIGRDDCALAIATLEGAGLHRMAPAFRTGWERRYGKDIALIGDERVEIDLHLALVAGYFGIKMPTAPLLDRLVTYEVAGRQMPALDTMGRLLHACIHTASSTPMRLGSAADVVQIAGSGDVDGGRSPPSRWSCAVPPSLPVVSPGPGTRSASSRPNSPSGRTGSGSTIASARRWLPSNDPAASRTGCPGSTRCRRGTARLSPAAAGAVASASAPPPPVVPRSLPHLGSAAVPGAPMSGR